MAKSKKNGRKKGIFSTAVLILVFFVGLSLLLYPAVSDYWNSFHQSKAISQYTEQVAGLDSSRYAGLLAEADRYNKALLQKEDRYEMSDEEREEYEALLNISGNGIIGYIEIPKLGCSLPIYHGTKESVLQIAVGHLEGSSLPVGGTGTHCVISGHRGLPRAKLFTDLDRLTEEDTFVLRILDERLTYEVDQIRIVEPYELDALEIEEGRDYCTLVTCTPYGINSHRLLVRGHRVENQAEAKSVRVTADAVQFETMTAALLLAVPMLFVLLAVLLISTRRKKKIRRKAL